MQQSNCNLLLVFDLRFPAASLAQFRFYCRGFLLSVDL